MLASWDNSCPQGCIGLANTFRQHQTNAAKYFNSLFLLIFAAKRKLTSGKPEKPRRLQFYHPLTVA